MTDLLLTEWFVAAFSIIDANTVDRVLWITFSLDWVGKNSSSSYHFGNQNTILTQNMISFPS